MPNGISLALIVVVGIIYCAVFVTLSIAVSSWTSHSSPPFLVLLVCWIVAVLVVPGHRSCWRDGQLKFLPWTRSPLRRHSSAHNSGGTIGQRLRSSTPHQSGNMDAMMKEFQEFMEKLASERDMKMRSLSERLNEQRANAQRLQEQWSLGLARVSPAAVMSLAITHIAGTGLELKDRFLKSASEYQEEFGKFMLRRPA